MENEILEIVLYHLFSTISCTFYFNRMGLDGFNDFVGHFFKTIFDHLFNQICVSYSARNKMVNCNKMKQTDRI